MDLEDLNTDELAMALLWVTLYRTAPDHIKPSTLWSQMGPGARKTYRKRARLLREAVKAAHEDRRVSTLGIPVEAT
jgi:hypothetical protein